MAGGQIKAKGYEKNIVRAKRYVHFATGRGGFSPICQKALTGTPPLRAPVIGTGSFSANLFFRDSAAKTATSAQTFE